MRNFGRALKMALRYRYSLMGAVFSSFMVAVFWGANIGAVYPFVEVVFQGDSLQGWVERRVAETDREAKEACRQAVSYRVAARGQPPAVAGKLASDGAHWQSQCRTYRQRLAMTRRLQPWIDSYLPDRPFPTLVLLVLFLVVGTVIKCVFLITDMVLVGRVSNRTVLDLQNAVFRKTLQLDLASLGTTGTGTGDLANRIRAETHAVGHAINTLFGKTLREPLKMLSCLVGAALVNWRLLLFSLIICPWAAYLTVKLAQAIKRANRRLLQESARLMNRLFQSLTYIKAVKAFNMESHERSHFHVVARDVYRKGMRIEVYSGLARVNNEVLGIGVVCLSVLAGGYLALNRQTHLGGIRLCSTPMEFGQIMLFYAFLVGISDPIRKLAEVYNVIQAGVVAADRAFELIDRRPQITSARQPQKLPRGPHRITFEKVKFSYQPGQPVLRQISFELAPGESLAILGANGCGKSTLVNLLPRFYDPDEGRILLDGVDIRQLRLKDLRRRIGLVTQQTMLFNTTIRENIRYGSLTAGDEEIVEAARRAHAHAFISRLPLGYETDVGEHGSRLSGGQQQRISLARTILKDPAILVLDEATSQIDPKSERLMHHSLRQFMRNRTTIMITHRLSTVDLAQRIMIMDQGEIVDVGSHEELLARCPLYQALRRTDFRKSA